MQDATHHFLPVRPMNVIVSSLLMNTGRGHLVKRLAKEYLTCGE
jgi:hypothetical protein